MTTGTESISADAVHLAEDGVESRRPDRRQAVPIHINFLDGVRGFAALYVAINHIYLFSLLGVVDGHSRWIRPFSLFKYGHSAVDLFIVLSGFCLMLPVALSGAMSLPRGIPSFLYRRARRILPPYYAALALSLIAVFLAPNVRTGVRSVYVLYDSGTFYKAVIAHLLLIHNLWSGLAYRINVPMWSVATEWQIYFVFAFILLPFRRRLGLGAPILFGIFVGWVTDRLGLTDASFWFIGSFAMGMAAAEFAYAPDWRGRFEPRNLGLATVVAGVISLMAIWTYDKLQDYDTLVPDLVFGFAAALFLLYGTVQSRHGNASERFGNLAIGFLGGKWPTGLGRFSYSLYLVHYPILLWTASILVKRHLDQAMTFLILICVGLPVVLTLAYLFHLAFEAPFLNSPAIRPKALSESA